MTQLMQKGKSLHRAQTMGLSFYCFSGLSYLFGRYAGAGGSLFFSGFLTETLKLVLRQRYYLKGEHSRENNVVPVVRLVK